VRFHGSVFFEIDFAADQAVVELARFNLERLHVAGHLLTVALVDDFEYAVGVAVLGIPNQDHQMRGPGEWNRRGCRGRKLHAAEVNAGRRPGNFANIDVVNEERSNDFHPFDDSGTAPAADRSSNRSYSWAMSRFDEVIDRRGRHARKWDDMEEKYGVSPDTGIPVWVADMEFRPPAAVAASLQSAIDLGVFGYHGNRGPLHDAIAGWMDRRHGWTIDPNWIIESHGLVVGMHHAVRALCEPGDGVIVQTPLYYPFSWAITRNGAQELRNPLVSGPDGRIEIDFDHLRSLITDRTKLLMLCSPHNPTGRVWTEAELTTLAEIAAAHDLWVLCDEVHHDLVYPDRHHTVFANLSAETAARTLTLTSASKTFNIAGTMVGAGISASEELRKRFRLTQEASGIFSPNLFGALATTAAYTHGDSWLAELKDYLKGNRLLMEKELQSVDGVTPIPTEGTYLAWLDCRERGLSMDELCTRTANAGLAVSRGDSFGPEGDRFLRFNFAMPRSVLTEALQRLARALAY